MANTCSESCWLNWTRRIVALGFLAYLTSFFLFDTKALFYSLVALPSLVLTLDFRLLVQHHKLAVSCILSFVLYFTLSSLWSDTGQLAQGVKLALSIVTLMLATHSTMNMRQDSALLIRYFILIVGSGAAFLYCFMAIFKGASAAGSAEFLAQRYSLQTLSGWGDNNPINTAICFGLVIVAAWWSFPEKKILVKLSLLLSIGASMALIMLTQSRGPFLSLLVVLFLISVSRRRRDDLILWGIALVTGIVAVRYFNLLPLLLDRAGSPNYRLNIWLNAIQQVKDNLFFGEGLGHSANIPILSEGGTVTVSHSHSSVLETFRVGGLAGGFLFLAMVVSVVCRSLVQEKKPSFFVFWLVFGLLCLSTNGRLPLIRPAIEWFCFWIPLFLIVFSPPKRSLQQ